MSAVLSRPAANPPSAAQQAVDAGRQTVTPVPLPITIGCYQMCDNLMKKSDYW
ncbi:hypothetical protein [Dickeya oryzae]